MWLSQLWTERQSEQAGMGLLFITAAGDVVKAHRALLVSALPAFASLLCDGCISSHQDTIIFLPFASQNQVSDALMEMYLQASATSLANLLGFESGGDSGMEDGGASQESSGETWMLAASTLPLLLDTSHEVVISDPYRMMTYSKQPDNRAFGNENIFIKPTHSNEVYAGPKTCHHRKPRMRRDLFDRQGKSKLKQRHLGRRKRKWISSFSPSFSSPAKIYPSSAPVKIKKGVGLISPEEVPHSQFFANALDV